MFSVHKQSPGFSQHAFNDHIKGGFVCIIVDTHSWNSDWLTHRIQRWRHSISLKRYGIKYPIRSRLLNQWLSRPVGRITTMKWHHLRLGGTVFLGQFRHTSFLASIFLCPCRDRSHSSSSIWAYTIYSYYVPYGCRHWSTTSSLSFIINQLNYLCIIY